MFTIHSRGEIPWTFGIEGIADDDLPRGIRPPLLEVVAIGDAVVIVTRPACFLWTVRRFVLDANGIAVERPNNNPLMFTDLGVTWKGTDDAYGKDRQEYRNTRCHRFLHGKDFLTPYLILSYNTVYSSYSRQKIGPE